MSRRALVILAVSAGCVDPASVTCPDGQLCPSGTTCEQLAASAQEICATAEELAACVGIAEGSACSTMAAPTSVCHGGVCLPIVCGNGRIDPGEVCDDGNTESGDGCSSNCSSNETCGNGIVDALKLTATGPELNEECDDGNRASGDGCSSTCLFEVPRWDELVTTAPPASSFVALGYDPVRGRVVMFGGVSGAETNGTALGVTREWNGSGWSARPADLAPVERWGARAVYDTARRRMLLLGGEGNSSSVPFADPWEWDGNRWTIAPGQPPPARVHFGMAYDSARKVVVVFGGFAPNTGPMLTTVLLADTWEWDGTTWTQITTAHAPSARYGFVMAYDPKRGAVVLAGGRDTGSPATTLATAYNDTWEYDGTDWHQTVATNGVELVDASAAFDPTRSQLIAYGGATIDSYGNDATPLAQTYAYTGTSWINLAQTGPGGRYGMELATDLATGRVVLFGGQTTSGQSADTWQWNGTTWSLVPAPALPSAPNFMASAYDPLTGLGWAFGGQTNSANGVNELWSFDGATWTRSAASGGPGARWGAEAAYDAAHRQIVVFGGQLSPSALAANDTWLWTGTAWQKASPTSSPGARTLASMAYDPKRGRVVLFGGATLTGVLDDTWEWDGTSWTQITAPTAPLARAGAPAFYEPGVGVIVGMGQAIDASGSLTFANDVWAWDGAAWTQRNTTTPLTLRAAQTMAFQLPRAHALVFGGTTLLGGAFDDTWDWDGASWSRVTTTGHPSPRGGQVALPGHTAGDLLLFGGFDGVSTLLDDTWRFRYDSGEPREQCELAVDNDGDGLAGCADPDCWTTCSPLCPPGQPCDASTPTCGDGICNAALENCRNCPGDCTCTPVCGDTFCEGNESHTTCPGDCP